MRTVAFDIMTSPVVSVRPDDTAADIAHLLSTSGIRAIPVTDVMGHVVGIVSDGDLLRPLCEAYARDQSWWRDLSQRGIGIIEPLRDYSRGQNFLAQDLMRSPVITVTPETDLMEVAQLLLGGHATHLPVVSGQKLVGIISRTDLVRAIVPK